MNRVGDPVTPGGRVGRGVGLCVGDIDGFDEIDGIPDGCPDRVGDAVMVGTVDGVSEGIPEGASLPTVVGTADGRSNCDGIEVGILDG